MIAKTSLKNHKPGTPIRESQCSRVLSVLIDFAAMSLPVTAEAIGLITNITQSTVHARLNDLFRGYAQNGVTYYAAFHSETVNTDGNACGAYTVTTVCPDFDAEENIKRLRKAAINAIVKYRTARKLAIKTLFDK